MSVTKREFNESAVVSVVLYQNRHTHSFVVLLILQYYHVLLRYRTMGLTMPTE